MAINTLDAHCQETMLSYPHISCLAQVACKIWVLYIAIDVMVHDDQHITTESLQPNSHGTKGRQGSNPHHRSSQRNPKHLNPWESHATGQSKRPWRLDG